MMARWLIAALVAVFWGGMFVCGWIMLVDRIDDIAELPAAQLRKVLR